MSHGDDDLEAQRLANYSDAVLRGQLPDAQGIDPLDAAIIRRLASLGAAATPDAAYSRKHDESPVSPYGRLHNLRVRRPRISIRLR